MSEPEPAVTAAPSHRLRRMTGRDPHEQNRVATPLELLFDLTFVIAFGLSAAQLADLLADGHVGAAVAGFAFSTFGVSWAWINFSWFASAYDTDDWLYRLTTMLQMIGVIVLALGVDLPDRALMSVEPGLAEWTPVWPAFTLFGPTTWVKKFAPVMMRTPSEGTSDPAGGGPSVSASTLKATFQR